ncbi:MAG: ABC transporter permease [Gemmatimonadaceae bacterium]
MSVVLRAGYAPPLARPRWLARRLPLSTALLVLMVLSAVAAPWLAPYDPSQQLDIVGLKNAPPSLAHPLGTDPYSRDLLSRLLHGGRVSLAVSGLATVVATILATAWGVMAASSGSVVGGLLMDMADALRAIPRKLLLLSSMLVVPHPSVLMLALLLGAGSWTALAQVVYTEARAVRAREFVRAAEALGVPPRRVLVHHVAPQLTRVVGAASATLLADLLAVEAGVSFLGLGVRPPTPSWGTILQDGVAYLGSAWWVAMAPALLLVLTVLAVARLADRLTGP